MEVRLFYLMGEGLWVEMVLVSVSVMLVVLVVIRVVCLM